MRSLVCIYIFMLMCSTCICIHTDPTQKDSPSWYEFWEYQTCGTILHPPSLYSDRLAVSSYDGYVYCLHRETGHLLWKREFPSKIIPVRTMNLEKDTLLIADAAGIQVLNSESGQSLWTLQMPIHDITVNGAIYLVTDTSLVCVNAHGDMQWKIPLRHPGLSTIKGVQDHQILLTDSPHVLTCYSKTGHIRWNFTPPNQSAITHVFVTAQGTFICAETIYLLDNASGNIRWILQRSAPLSHAVITEDHLLLRDTHELFCIKRKNGNIMWKKALSSYTLPIHRFAVHGEDLFLPQHTQNIDTIIQESDGSIVKTIDSHPCMSIGGTRSQILYSTPREGVVCIDERGEILWNHYMKGYCYEILMNDRQVLMTGTDGKIVGFFLTSQNPFPQKDPTHSQLPGTITSLRIIYSFDFCLELIFGEIYLIKVGESYRVQDSYEDGTVYVTGERCFTGKVIPKDMVDSLGKSITNLYVHSSHTINDYPAYGQISVEITLETGESIRFFSGRNISQFIPWTITFKNHEMIQYSGEIQMALFTLMDEIGWGFKEWNTFQQWGYVNGGFCEHPLSLSDLT